MNKTIELSTGKIVDLSRFVALIPNDETAENPQYSLILEGYSQSIDLNSEEVILIKKHLQENATPSNGSGARVVRVDNQKKHGGTWDREEQLRLNQPKMKKLKEKIERMKQEEPSEEKTEFFDITDAEFISQKLESELDAYNSYAERHWDKEAQLQKNQPLMKLVKQWQQQKNGKPATEEEIQEYQDIQESLKRNH